jgi:hypothetical protein
MDFGGSHITIAIRIQQTHIYTHIHTYIHIHIHIRFLASVDLYFSY